MPFAPAFQPWDHFFTIVMWDQRGEGKTFEKNGESEAPMTVEQMTADGIELTEFLRRHLHKDKIILLGHSWGSVLGIHMIKSRPDLFAAYVGTGQVTHLSSQLEAAYPLLLKRAMLNSEAERELTAIGPPPWKSEDAYDVVNKWGEPFEPPPAPPTEEDRRTWMRLPRPQPQPYIQSGREFSHRMLDDALAKEDLPAIATQFSVPIIFIQGEDDLITATSVVKAYFDRIVSKDKRFIVLPGCGHDAIFRDRARFLAELVAQVRPLAMKSSH
jgi:pimeloyl-ACP methyl ester carboxylesterase